MLSSNEYITSTGYKITVDDLHKFSDVEIANTSGLSRQRIFQIRKQLSVPSNKTETRIKTNRKINETRTEKIINYIKNNPNNICVKLIKKKFYWKANKTLIQRIAIENSIKISFKFNKSIYEHSLGKYQHKKCDCKICKLANSIYCNKKLDISITDADRYANLYINEYLSYRNKKLFYVFYLK